MSSRLEANGSLIDGIWDATIRRLRDADVFDEASLERLAAAGVEGLPQAEAILTLIDSETGSSDEDSDA